MDRILNYLPEIVHIRIGYDNEPRFYGDHPGVTWVDYEMPKIWLKHGERGRYNEWSIKETYKKKLAREFGENFLHSTERIEVKEWNQLENVAGMLRNAKNIGFDNIFEIAKTVNEADIKYTHNINV